MTRNLHGRKRRYVIWIFSHEFVIAGLELCYYTPRKFTIFHDASFARGVGVMQSFLMNPFLPDLREKPRMRPGCWLDARGPGGSRSLRKGKCHLFLFALSRARRAALERVVFAADPLSVPLSAAPCSFFRGYDLL